MILPWEEAFELGEPSMDATHREFVDRLNRLDEIPDNVFPEYFDELLEHTRNHFEEENARMASSKFLSIREHKDDHDRILAEMMQMQRFAAKGMTKIARSYVKEKLPDWFKTHAASMDTALALHLK